MLTVDVDMEALVDGFGQPVECLSLVRGPARTVGVQFKKGGRLVPVGAGAETGALSAKSNLCDDAFLFQSTPWTILAGPPPTYALPVAPDTDAVRALLKIGVEGRRPFEVATVAGDFRWADGNGKTFVARPFAIKLLNPALIGGETSAGGGSITGSGSWSFIERLSGGTATDLDAQPTLIIATDFLVLMVGVADPGADGALVNGGGLTAWQLQARAGRDLAAGMIQPLDYNAQTNDRFWVQVQ